MSLRDHHLQRLRNEHFDVLVVGPGSTARSPRRRWPVAAPRWPSSTVRTSAASPARSRATWSGAASSTSRTTSCRWCSELCESRNRLMKAYPDNVKEISFLATAGQDRPYKPWFAALGATAYWGHRPVRHQAPRLFDAEKLEAVEPVIDTSTARGRGAVPGLLPRRQRLRGSSSPSSAPPSRPAPPSPTTSSWSRPSVSTTAGWPRSATPTPARSSSSPPRRRQRRRPVRRRAQRLVGPAQRPPHRVLQGHPPRRTATHDARPRPRARVLRRHPAPLLRHPDGSSLGHRHHRHPRRDTVHRRHRRGPRVPARADQRPPRPRGPLTHADIIAERSGVRPLVVPTSQRRRSWFRRGSGDADHRRSTGPR